MVKNIIIRLLIQNSGKIFNSVREAYKRVISRGASSANNTNSSQQQQQDNSNNNEKQGGFGKFSFQNLVSSPLTKDEALKILDLHNSTNVNYTEINEKANKLIEMNNPEKGGSFYIQNKVFYAREFLIKEYPPTEEEMSQENQEDEKKEEEVKEEVNNERNTKL